MAVLHKANKSWIGSAHVRTSVSVTGGFAKSYAWDFCCHINEKCYMIIRRWTGTALSYMFVRSKHAYSLSIASRGCKGAILDRENRPEQVLRCKIGKSAWETAWNCYVSGMSDECQGSFVKGTSRRVVGSLIKRARCFVLKYFFRVTDIFAVHFLQETKKSSKTPASASPKFFKKWVCLKMLGIFPMK